MQTWLLTDPDSDFSIHNLPYGIFSTKGTKPRAGIALGDLVLDLPALSRLGLFPGIDVQVFRQPVLNPFIEQGIHTRVREAVQSIFRVENRLGWEPLLPTFSHKRADVMLHLPLHIGDYTDFYASEYHATRVGKRFRPDNPLMPNWKSLPVAYHGRAGSVVVSGTNFPRPKGQILQNGKPAYLPTESLDYELEVAAVIGRNTQPGTTVPAEEAEACIFGFVLLNDWSARDIQRWEYQPLGPFLGKNFCTSISPWIVPLDALDPFRVAEPEKEILPYLKTPGNRQFDIRLEVRLNDTVTARTNLADLYWNFSQMVVHHTSNGCNLSVGDLLASGTVSGPDGEGCLLERTEPVLLSDGSSRTYLLDGDRVTLSGFGRKGDIRVGFGEVTGRILPAHDIPLHDNP